jgi:hypothetical protein
MEAGEFQFDRGHAKRALANVVGEWYGRVADEAQDSIGMSPKRHSRFAATDCLPRPRWPVAWVVLRCNASALCTKAWYTVRNAAILSALSARCWRRAAHC